MKYVEPHNGIPYEQEPPQAKIRNLLGPMWTLISLCDNEFQPNCHTGLDEDSIKLFRTIIDKCRENQPLLLQMLDMTYAFPWNEFKFQQNGNYPAKYGKYFVRRKDGKIHWETWNGSGWAYNGNTITHWLEISGPLGYEVDGNATG